MNTDTVMADYYRLGYSLKQVGDIMGLNRKTVGRRLVAQGVDIRPSNNVKRSEWLTESKAQEV